MRVFILLNAILVILLSSLSVTASPPEQADYPINVVPYARLKLRDGPSPEWTILGFIEPNEIVRLDGRAPFETLWVRGMNSDGQLGWMIGEYFSTPASTLMALPIVSRTTPSTLTPPDRNSQVTVISVPPPGAESAGSPQIAASGQDSNVISGITDNARAIFLHGQELGNRANVFSKVGDSITASRHFLFPIGWGSYNLGSYSSLQGTVNYFLTAIARDGNNSFANPSLAAYNGITTGGLLDPNASWKEVCEADESPLECEYRVVKPAVALIMIGTNDVASLPADAYRANLQRIVQISIDDGVVPVLSLIPVRPGYESNVSAFNQIITETARAYNVPLWNFGTSLQSLENNGLGDGIHPSYPGASPTDFAASVDLSAANLRYGYPLRNLSALQVLDTLRRRVLY